MEKHSIIKLIKSTNPSKLLIFIGVSIAFISQAGALVIPMLTRNLIDQEMINISIVEIVVIVSIFIATAILNGVSYYIISFLGTKVVSKIRQRIWNIIIYLPLKYFDETLSGESVSRIINDTNILKDLISERVINFFTGIFTLIAALIILFYLDVQLTLIILIAAPLTLLIVIPLGRRVFKISVTTQEKTAKLTANISQSLSEIRLIKASNAEEVEKEATKQSVVGLFLLGLKEAKVYAFLFPIMSGVTMLIIFGIIGYGGLRVSSGTLSSGTLIAFILYLFQIIVPITEFSSFFTQFQKTKGATKRINEILNEKTEIMDDGKIINLEDKTITFDNVSFGYNDEKLILKNLNFEIKPNQKVAIVGPSGSGKTTIFSLIERFYQPNEGKILVDETDINEYSLYNWRLQIGYVFQENALFALSIRENITYGLQNDVSDEQIWNALKQANAYDIVNNLPQKLDSIVGERGSKLSGGEKQRISIARAILRNPKLLLLDEATASLDSRSEKAIQDALVSLMNNRTTIIIAHRLATIIDSDVIIFLEDGQITGMGTHQQLVDTHKLYAEFAKAQLKR